MRIKKLILISLLLIGAASVSYAGSSSDDVKTLYKYRTGVDLEFKLYKGLKLNVAPELRFYEGFDMLMLNAGLSYKTFGCIYWGASYRLELDREESSSSTGFGNSYEWDKYNRYAFDVTFKERYGRFTPSFRTKYCNYADDDLTDENELRYRAKVAYDIPKCKITPFVSAEAMQELEEMMLYKMRYNVGASYEFSKNASVSLDYKLDYFLLKYKNTHIFSANYKYKF